MISRKYILVIFLALISFSQIIPAQTPIQFTDRTGNQFTITKPKQLHRKMNAQFLKRELRADSLRTTTEKPDGPCTFEVHEIRLDSVADWYDIRLMSWPQNASAFERGTTYTGYAHYRMRVGRLRGRLRVLRLYYDFGEI